ncbi:Alpha/Beta hydrolase protein [Lasiosphaeria hispida]|uniref:Alpha/Beta hydrolase protein n=1 Tax=Lasiosphaeria hispida TaxID=260671 RepID=A0AAJ0HNL8_9PEZI|nr:Alpha/Beta hydrolase protein [Lasiosphaeria hispida]
MDSSALRSTILAICLALGVPAVVYVGLLGAMIAAPSSQTHAIYLHKITLTWFKDLNVPEQFGFAHHQVTPFYIPTSDGEKLHAWHVLPLGAYLSNEDALLAQGPGGGLVEHFQETLNFRLLRENPNARLVLYFHGASGTMASGWRPDSYRSLYAADPANTHILTFDYRGYGLSSGWPSEPGLITDALAVAGWALGTAGIPPERIVIFGQSLGSAVAIALVNELSNTRREPSNKTHFAGLVVTATFSHIVQLTATYRIGGVIPVLSPVAKVPLLFDFFTRRLQSTWDNMQRLGEFIQGAERYHVTLLHAEDDTDIPMEHSVRLFREAVRNSAAPSSEHAAGSTGSLLDGRIEERTEMRGQGGAVTVWPTPKGDIRLELLKYGVHDKIMSFPVTGLAVSRAFRSAVKSI